MKRTMIETYQLDQIPVLTMAPEGAQNCPVVIWAHSFGADRAQGLNMGYELAQSGFFFLSLDAPMHGSRPDERLDRLVEGRGPFLFPQACGLDIFALIHEIIVETAMDIHRLLARLDQDSRADTSRVGLSGFSMGGFTTFYSAATNPRIQVAVPMGGVPTFAERWADVVLESSTYEQWTEDMAGAEAEAAERLSYMEEIDPTEGLRAFAPKPLKVIVGDKDSDAPKKYSVDLYRMLKPRYRAHPDRLRLSIHDEIAHDLTTAMIQEACDWFRRFLSTNQNSELAP